MSKIFDQSYFRQIEKANAQEKNKKEFDYILKHVEPRNGERVLDIGCGIGTFGKTIISQNKNVEVFFSDISEVAAEYLGELNFTHCSAEETPFPDEYFDKVYCLHTISHVNDRKKVIKELYRITKKGGVLALIGPNRNDVYLRKIASFLRIIPPYHIDKTAKWFLSPRGIRSLLASSGWHIATILYFGEYTKRSLPLDLLRLRILAIAKK